MQSLPIALQQRSIEWAEEFIDLILRKQTTMQNIRTSLIPPKSALAVLKFNLGASQTFKEVLDK